MHERVERLPSAIVSVERDRERELEAELLESSTLVFKVAYSVLRQREDAEDVAQEALTKAFRTLRQLRDRERLRAWLVRLTWRMALDRQRADRRRLNRHRLIEEMPLTAAARMNAAERASSLWEAIDELPTKLRLTIVLAGIEGHDVREVAALLGVPEGTVKSRLFLARKRLRERLSWMAGNGNE